MGGGKEGVGEGQEVGGTRGRVKSEGWGVFAPGFCIAQLECY